MSAKLIRDLSAQQRTIRNQLVTINRQQSAIDDALVMLRAGHVAQAVKDLERVRGGAK